MPTFTGSKHSGGVSSYVQSSRSLNVDGTPFGASDFNVPRIVAIFSSSNNFKGFAYVRRLVDNNTIELESNPFDPITNLDINVLASDNYNTSLNFAELAGGGVSVTNTEVNVTDAIVFGTAGNERSLCFYDEEKDVRQAAGGVWLLNGGVIIFGHLLDRASGAFQAPVNIVFTGNSHRFRANNIAAHFAIYGGTVYAQATPAFFGGNGGSAAGTFLASRTVFSQIDLTSRGAGDVWLQNAERHVLRNITNTVSANNSIAVRWGDGGIEGGLFKLSRSSSLSVFGADADGTYFIGAPADQRITIPEVGDGTSTKPGLWRTGNSARVITVEYTNVVTANKDHNAGSVGNPGPNLNAIFKYRDSYSGGVSGTNILIKNSGGTTVASGVSNGTDPVLLEVIESTVVGETVTVVENNWQWGSHAYGKNIVSGTFSTQQVETISGNANNVSHAQRLLQSDNVSVTENRSTVENYPISISLNASTITVTGNASTVRDMDAIQFYDLMELYLTENYDLETATFVDRAGNSVDTKNRGVVFNFINYTGSLEASNSLTLNNNSGIQSGTYSNDVVTLAGKTFTDVTIPSGNVLQVMSGGTITLDASDIDRVENISGSNVTVVLINGSSVPTLSQTNGSITLINDMSVTFNGLQSGDLLYVRDNNGVTQELISITGNSQQITITQDNGGELWGYSVKRIGFAVGLGTFDVVAGSTLGINISLIQQVKDDGSPMYGATTTPLMTVEINPDGSSMRGLIGNGAVSAQQYYDVTEVALMSEDGLSYLFNGGGACTFSQTPTGTFLSLKDNYQVKRRNAGDDSATVNAFVTSTQGTFIDSVNGTVLFVTVTTAQQLTEYAGFIWVDLIAGVDEFVYPAGTPTRKVNSIANAITLGDFFGINKIKLSGAQTTLSQAIDGYEVFGDVTTTTGSRLIPSLELSVANTANNSVFKDLIVSGATDVSSPVFGNKYIDCVINGLTGLTGVVRSSKLVGVQTVVYDVDLVDCYGTTALNVIGTDSSVSMPNFSGQLTIAGMTSPGATISIGVVSGVVTVDSSCTAGTIIIANADDVENNGNGVTVIEINDSSGGGSGGGGDDAATIYNYFTTSNREGAFKATGFATPSDVNSTQSAIINAIGSLNNLSAAQVTAAVPSTAQIEAALINDGDGQQLIDAIVTLINTNLDLPALELAAIASQVRVELSTELARIDRNLSTLSTFNASTDSVTVSTNNDKSGYSLANNSITSSTVANNAFNNNTFTTGFYNQIGGEVDSSLLSYDGPTKAELDAAIGGLATQASVNNIPQAVDVELTANHGSGSWVESTGFATPSDVSSGFDEIKGVGWTNETLKDIRDNLGSGGTTPQQVYDYFVAGSRENVFKADISGVATTVQLNAARDSVISEVNNSETKIDNLQSSVTNLENISVSDIRTGLATELSRLDVDVSSVAYNDTALTALVNALPTLSEMEASDVLTAVADITGLSTHSAEDVVTAMQAVADQFKADVSNLSTFNANTDEVTTDNASRVASRATGFATPSDVSSALNNYDAPTKAELDTAVNSVLSAISNLPDSGSISGLLQKLELLEKYHDNTTAYLDATGSIEVEQKDAYFTVVYDNDGTTELKRIAFQNSLGAPAIITEASRYVKV